MAEISVSIEEAPKKHADLPCGYDEVFVSLVDDDLQCSICQSTLRDPVLTRCGHRFCKDCLGRYISRFVFSSEYERITLNTLRISKKKKNNSVMFKPGKRLKLRNLVKWSILCSSLPSIIELGLYELHCWRFTDIVHKLIMETTACGFGEAHSSDQVRAFSQTWFNYKYRAFH